jgi:hypothetical protein
MPDGPIKLSVQHPDERWDDGDSEPMPSPHGLKFVDLDGKRVAVCTHSTCPWAKWAPGNLSAWVAGEYRMAHSATYARKDRP